jgi:hypothetical protein
MEGQQSILTSLATLAGCTCRVAGKSAEGQLQWNVLHVTAALASWRALGLAYAAILRERGTCYTAQRLLLALCHWHTSIHCTSAHPMDPAIFDASSHEPARTVATNNSGALHLAVTNRDGACFGQESETQSFHTGPLQVRQRPTGLVTKHTRTHSRGSGRQADWDLSPRSLRLAVPVGSMRARVDGLLWTQLLGRDRSSRTNTWGPTRAGTKRTSAQNLAIANWLGRSTSVRVAVFASRHSRVSRELGSGQVNQRDPQVAM